MSSSESPNPADRRGSLVRLTDADRVVIDDAMSRHVRIERDLVSGLDEREQTQLRTLLAKLLSTIEDR